MWILWASLAVAQEQMDVSVCFTMENWDNWIDVPMDRTGIHLRKTEKMHRDVYGIPENNIQFSEHFAVHWGDDFAYSSHVVANILDMFEYSWQVEIEELGFAPPGSTNEYYFNIYLGSTGSNTPDDYGVAGYYYTDSDNYPMIVLSEYVWNNWNSAQTTIPHEFFHALQHQTGVYSQDMQARWYWEATANWMESIVLPSKKEYAVFLFGYAYVPHLPLDFFQYYQSGALEEYHAYGAFIFPKYISEYWEENIVVSSWIDSQTDTPMEWYTEYFVAEPIEDVLADFVAHNAYWDYQDGEAYRAYIDYYRGQFSSEDHEITKEIPSTGTLGWLDAPTATLPEQYGYNQIRIHQPSMENIRVAFDGNAIGTAGGHVQWTVQLITKHMDQTLSYQKMVLEDNLGNVDIQDTTDILDLTLSVFAYSTDARSEEGFVYRYSMTTIPVVVEEEPENKSSCQHISIDAIVDFNLLGFPQVQCFVPQAVLWQRYWVLFLLGMLLLCYPTQSPTRRHLR